MKNLLRAVLVFFSFSSLAMAQGYEELPNPPKRADTDRVEVVEYFWFGCPHCFAFEPTINKWAEDKPDYVDFVREAPPLNPAWAPHSQAFYAAEVLGITDQMFDQFFDAIHKDKKRLNSPKSISKWVGGLGIEGVDADKFQKTMKSFAVDAKIRRAMELARNERINSVPSVVINGKYKTTGSMAGSNQKVIEVINELTASEHSS